MRAKRSAALPFASESESRARAARSSGARHLELPGVRALAAQQRGRLRDLERVARRARERL
jgi:hypothetical protein